MPIVGLRPVANFLAMLFVGTALLPAEALLRKSIIVTQATDVEVTISPDRKTILADIQGMIYSLPFSGGAANSV